MKTSGKRFVFYLALSVSALTFLVYLPALRNGFLTWDDDVYVTNNWHIRSISPGFLKWAFAHFYASNWHPLTWISHAVDYALWGLNPMGHHFTSIVLHAANTFLVVLLCARLLEVRERNGYGHRTLIAAGVTGLLFGLHPLHVESVAWVAERKDVLCAFFFLLSIGAYMSYASDRINKSYRLHATYFLSLFFFILALLSKPMAVSLPAVLLILNWYPFGRIRSLRSVARPLGELVPFMILSLGASAVTFFAQSADGAVISVVVVPVATRVLVAARSLFLYLWKMIYPSDISPFYSYPEHVSLFAPKYLLAVVSFAGICALCVILARKNQKMPAAAWAYYLITLLPVIGLVQVASQSMADRYTYLPSLGPFLLAGIAAGRTPDLLKGMMKRDAAARAFTVAASVCLIAALCVLSLKQIGVWRDSIVLWNTVIRREPYLLPFAYNNRGQAYKERGQLELALQDYSVAIDLDPSSFVTYVNRGMTFGAMGQFGPAIEDYSSAIALKPFKAKPYLERGIVYAETGRLDLAMQDFDKAIAIEPTYADAYTSRGLTLQKNGEPARAIDDFDRAISLNPSSIDAYLDRGVAFERLGRFEQAISDYSRAIKLNPYDYLAYENRGIVFARMGRTDQAIGDYSKALSLKPDFTGAFLDRGDTYKKIGNKELAEQDYRRACDLGSKEGCESLRRFGRH